jgi:hypothetical protein
MDEPRTDRVHVEVEVALPQFPIFARDHPPGASAQHHFWDLVPQIIDYGAAVLNRPWKLRPGQETRDVVTAAIMRRALATTEAIYNLSYHGLPESAMALLRTLLDLELNIRLVTKDSTARTAKRLAAYHYLLGQRHGQRMVASPETRDTFRKTEGVFEEMLDTTRRYKNWLEAPGFDEVRDEVVPGRPWHGFNSAEEAFQSVGMVTDYHQIYDLGTFFVHATNVEFDLAEPQDGHIAVRSPLTDEEPRLLSILGLGVAHFFRILELYVGDRGLEQGKAQLRVEGQEPEEIGEVEAVGILIGQALPATVRPAFGSDRTDAVNSRGHG